MINIPATKNQERRSLENGIPRIAVAEPEFRTPSAPSDILRASRMVRFGYSLADQVLAVGGMFAVNIALARLRSKEEYGTFALTYSIFTLLAGLHNAAILEVYTIYGSGRYHHRFAEYGRLLWRTNTWLLVGLTALLLATWQSLRWVHPAFASPALLGMALASGVFLTASFARRTFYMRRRPDLAARFSAAFFGCCILLLALVVRRNLLNGLSAYLITALAWAMAALTVRYGGIHSANPGSRGTGAGVHFLLDEPKYWSEHWSYSRWVLVTAMVFQFTTQIYFWVVAGALSVRDVAELRALYNIALPVDQIFVAITLLVLPQMALQFTSGAYRNLRRLWWRCSLIFLAISSAFALTVGSLSQPLLHLVYGGKFDTFAPLLRWYALLPVVMSIGNAANAALKAIEKPRAVFYAYATSGATTFLVGIPLIVRLGLRGAVYGMLVSAASYSAVLFFSCYRLSGPDRLDVEPVYERVGQPICRPAHLNEVGID